MRFFEQKTGNVDAYYEPNSFGGAAQDERYAEPPLKIAGDAERYNHRDGNDDYKHGTVQSVSRGPEGASLPQRGGSHVGHSA